MENTKDALFDLIEEMGTCMLVTHDGKIIRSRPMHPIVERATGQVRFLTSGDASVDTEIDIDPRCNLSFAKSGNQNYLSVSGEARTSRDVEAIKRSWNAGADLYFPDGPEKSNVVLILVDPTHAEYWDGDSNTITRAWEIMVSKLHGKTPDLGENHKITLNQVSPDQ
ncbi:MAG: pyridoxamine 5'-phosphate oxidase family protein [Pseudomonadota bacterium]